MKIDKDLKYEDALSRLQEIVNLLELKEIKIDELSERVTEAKALVDYCRLKLEKTEEEINKIIQTKSADDIPEI